MRFVNLLGPEATIVLSVSLLAIILKLSAK